MGVAQDGKDIRGVAVPCGDIKRFTLSSASKNSSFFRYLIPSLLQLI